MTDQEKLPSAQIEGVSNIIHGIQEHLDHVKEHSISAASSTDPISAHRHILWAEHYLSQIFVRARGIERLCDPVEEVA